MIHNYNPGSMKQYLGDVVSLPKHPNYCPRSHGNSQNDSMQGREGGVCVVSIEFESESVSLCGALTFSDWASRDFRLLVTFLSSSSRSLALLWRETQSFALSDM